MKIIITGATGLIGRTLCEKLISRGDGITVFSRNVEKAKKNLPQVNNFVEWDYKNPDKWDNEIKGKDAVIHLAGANLFGKRWNDDYKSKILESRQISTRNIVNAIINAKTKPSTLICSSAVGIYGERGDELLTEDSSTGNDFLAQVCKTWEDEAAKVESAGVRRVSIRTGIVLSKNDGALKQMLLPFKFFVGGPLGNGKQWFPWIHIDDLIDSCIFSLDNPNVNGAVNGVSPNPVTMNEFAKVLGKALHRPSFFKVPVFALKIAVGEFAESILASIRAVPEKLIRNNFKFKFEGLNVALKDLLKL
jgi:hypothetical protein